MSKVKIITRNVLVLSAVSLFTDIASEMLYPIVPIYLKTIGFSIVLIGILEGFAEAIAGLSKGYFGNLSDRTGTRLPFIQIGYLFSAISKPMMALFTYPIWVFFVRTIDRLGKGVRTGARDALLSDEATADTKGRVFGFHRSMDTFGAVLGPLLALMYLVYRPDDYKTLFYLAFFPGLISIGFTFFIKEKPSQNQQSEQKSRIGLLSFVKYWRTSPATYRKLVTALLVFTLFNSSDVFLLLKIKEAGLDDTMAIGAYIFYNLIYAIASYPMGTLADKIGMKKVLVSGLILFAIVYLGMAYAESSLIFLALFFLYGIYAAATEGIAKAWITNLCSQSNTATAIGTYTAFQSIATLLASSLAGLIWFYAGAPTTFLLSGITALIVSVYISRFND
ncbi:MFS transporter [Chamaesiphon sp.]|uniref:MFS transporter n=1 Tax=Chamaesiphon sp. TaxID=2814140 RepID=UPI003593212F